MVLLPSGYVPPFSCMNSSLFVPPSYGSSSSGILGPTTLFFHQFLRPRIHRLNVDVELLQSRPGRRIVSRIGSLGTAYDLPSIQRPPNNSLAHAPAVCGKVMTISPEPKIHAHLLFSSAALQWLGEPVKKHISR